MKKDTCPVCGYEKYRYVQYAEECFGIVERHGFCSRCGYVEEQCYSDTVTGFLPALRRGYKDRCGKYHAKNSRSRKRLKRKYNIKYGKDDWKLVFIM